MGIELIDDKDPVSLGVYRKGAFNVVLEIFFCPGLAQCWIHDLTGGHLKVSDQATGAMPFVFELLVFHNARLHRKCLMGAFLGLYARFFIGADQMRALFVKRNRMLIQRTDRLALPVKGFFIHIRWAFPIAHLMWL